jgi:hypothetical protein
LTDIQNQAKQQQTGWLYIIDLRRHSSERADPLESMLEDIIGAFRIHDSKIISESYQPIIEHKILSARGFFKIQPELHEHLIEKCFAEVI